MDVRLSPKLINKRFRNILSNSERYQIYYGGSSSSKSYSVFLLSVLWALEGRAVLVVRANDAHITRSVWSEVIKGISKLKLRKYFDINKSDRTIRSKVSKGSIQFTGVLDVEKLKSITPVSANAFDTVICEEATELTEDTFNQILLRQRGKSKFPKRAILLFNPVHITHWIYKRFFKEKENDIDYSQLAFDEVFYTVVDVDENELESIRIHKSTYRDNIHLDKSEINTLKGMKTVSPYHYEVYANGNFGVTNELVYEDIKYISKQQFKNITKHGNWVARAGLDIGYHDLLAFTLSFYNSVTGEIIIVDEFAKTKVVDVKGYAREVQSLLIEWDQPMNLLITADNSGPRESEIMRGTGLNIRRSIKGAGSKFAGLMFLKSKSIMVLDTCNKVKESFRIYSWKKGKDGIYTDDTLHDGSDLLDAFRYSYELDMRNNKTVFGRK